MLGLPATPVVAAAQALAVALLLLIIGRLIVSVLLGERLGEGHWPWTLSFAGACMFGVLAMVFHIVTGGALFSSPWGTRAFTLSAATALAACQWYLRARGRVARSDRTTLLLLGGVAAVALLIWCSPVARSLPLSHGGDTVLHTGWANQLLDGEPTPSGPVPGDIPNFYPWLTHALMALLARLIPGGTTYHALAPLQLLQVTGAVLALFGLGQQLAGKAAGLGAALFGGLAGGFGFLLVRGLDVVMDPRQYGERYLGDLLAKRSYNSSFFNISPAFPRDIAFALVVCFLLLLIMGLRRRDSLLLAGAGIALGLTGLTGAEALFVGFGALVLLLLAPPNVTRGHLLGAVIAPALIVYVLWLGPQIYHYLRLGGYVNLTMVENVTLSWRAVLTSWGISLPFAAFGILVWLKPHIRETPQRVVAAWIVTATILLLGSSTFPDLLGGAFEAIGRPHRYWPYVYLGLVMCAAAGAQAIIRILRGKRWALVGAGATTLLFALPSPIIASVALPEKLRPPLLITHAMRGSENALLNLLRQDPGEQCIVSVPVKFGGVTWSYTGYRVLMFVWPNRHEGNLARIRWRDIYDQIATDDERRAAQRILMAPNSDRRQWDEVINRYDVDAVALETAQIAEELVAGRQVSQASDVAYSVVTTSECES
jgi:hypothetical protein